MSLRVEGTLVDPRPYALSRVQGVGGYLRPGCAAFIIAALASSTAHASWPTLDDVARIAQARAPALAEARGQLAAANASVFGARVSPVQNPYVEVFTDAGKFTKDVQVQANVWVPIEITGQRGARINEAEHLVKLKSRSLTETRARVLGECVTAYGELMVLSARLEQAKKQEDDSRAELDFFSGKLAAQDTTLYEKSGAEAELGRWVQQRVELEVQLVQARSRLAILLGKLTIEAPPQNSHLYVPQLRIAFTNEQARDLAKRSPLVGALTTEVEYWTANRDRAVAERNGPVNFIVSLGRGDSGETRYGGGLSWTFPLLQRNQGPIAKADAERARTIEVKQTVEQVLESRVLSLYEMMHTTQDAVKSIDASSIPAAERVVDAATQLWKAGKTDPLKVWIARRDLASARARRLDLVAAGFRTYGELAVVRGELP